MVKKFKVMASNAKEPDGKCIPKSMRKSVESACGKKKAVKASDSECKYRIDIFKKDNPDALVKREFKMFKSEDEAKKYGESVANGNIVNVMKVNAGCTKKSVKSGKVLFPWAMVGRFADGYTCEVSGDSEADCIEKLGNMQDKHGELEYYSGVDDDDYDADGRRIYSSRTKRFGVKASKAAKKRVAAAKGYWADDINAENYRKILKALDDYLIANYDGKTIGDVEIGVSELRSIKDDKGSKIEVEFYSPDYEKDTKLEIISAPDLRSKFLCRVSVDPFKFDEELEIPQSGSKQIVVDKINEIANRLSGSAVESSCKTKKTVKASSTSVKKFGIKASALAKRKAQQRITASDSYYDEDIVFYFNGKKQFEGSIFDLAGNVEILCHDPKVMQVFQDYCNQFGDPIDFDGTPRDTALVFTKLVMFEAEEANEPSDFYVEYSDYRKPGSFEIYYANEGIYSAKSINCWDNGNDVWEYQESYDNYYDEEPPEHIAKELERLAKLTDKYTDRWFEKFEELHPGERFSTVYPFPDVDEAVGYTLDDAEYRPDEIGASKSIKCSDADGIADEWEDIREVANQDSYEYDGFEDSDMLEYVDRYMQDPTSGAWLSADHVVYNNPDDWEVRASLSPEAVETDFWFFLDDVDHDLYEEMLETEVANPLDEDPIHYVYNQNAVNGNEFFIELYPTNNQMSAPQIDFDEKYLTPEWLDRLVKIRKQYEESRKAAYTEFQSGLGAYLANGITASTDIKAGITVGEDSRFDFSNPIYELDDYVKAIADGVVNRIQGITYDISKETIAFFDADNNVVFVQPIGGIIPEPDDLETDINELSAAIRSEMDSAYGRDKWEQDNDDPDYASIAVELSEDIGEVDIDDLEYVTGEDDEPADMGYGYDSNGDAIDESTVEELYRIAEYEILPKSELAKIDEYVSIDEDSWDFYMSSPHVTEKFYIHFKLTEKDIDFNDYTLPDGKMFPDFNYYTAVLDFDIYAENGEITSVILEDKEIYRPDGAFDDYDVKQFDDLYNVEALINYVEHLAADTVKDIYNGTTNL